MLGLKKGTQFCDVYVRLHIYHYKWNIWILVNSKYFCFECFIEQINVTVIGWAQKGCLCELNTFVTVAQLLKSGELILHPLWWASIRKGGGPSNTAAVIWYCWDYCIAWYWCHNIWLVGILTMVLPYTWGFNHSILLYWCHASAGV